MFGSVECVRPRGAWVTQLRRLLVGRWCHAAVHTRRRVQPAFALSTAAVVIAAAAIAAVYIAVAVVVVIATARAIAAALLIYTLWLQRHGL